MKSSIINIQDMACSGCASTVEKALNDLEGVNNSVVELESGTAKVEFSGEPLSEEALRKAVSNAGYTVTDIR